MCNALFIGSDREISLIQYKEGITPFHIMNIDETDKTIMDKIEKPYIYYIGAYEGCGCGFRYGVTEIEYGKDVVDSEEEIKGRQSVEALFNFLLAGLKAGEEVILYNSWEGEFEQPTEKETTININTFVLPVSFKFDNHHRVRIVKDL